MPGNFNKLVTVSTGQLITAAERNNEFDNVITNMTPAGLDDESATVTAMRAVADPYPASVESLPTDLKGEVLRMRYIFAQMSGNTYWYQDPVLFHDRGDPSSVDFAIGVLTVDAAFHDLDLSAIVPDGTTAVLLNVQVTSSAAGGVMDFRKKGNSNSINIGRVITQVGSVLNSVDIVVPCSTARVIEYKVSGGVSWTPINITVKGYWR